MSIYTKHFDSVDIKIDPARNIGWMGLKPKGIPCIQERLIYEIAKAQEDTWKLQLKFLVLTSESPEIFSLGGDLGLFVKGDRGRIERYALECIKVIFDSLSTKQTTIALVRGKAYGGGFEAALAQDIIVAEESAEFCFPECLYNLFPGMGAYNFIFRRTSAELASTIVTNAKTYTAKEMGELGVIEIVVPDGKGEQVIGRLTDPNDNLLKEVVSKKKAALRPITFEDLQIVVEHWIDKVMTIEKRDLGLIKRILKVQRAKWPQQ